MVPSPQSAPALHAVRVYLLNAHIAHPQLPVGNETARSVRAKPRRYMLPGGANRTLSLISACDRQYRVQHLFRERRARRRRARYKVKL